MLMGFVDQTGGQISASSQDGLKAAIGRLFDALKTGDAFVVNFDFSPDGLAVAGNASVKLDSKAAARLVSAKTNTAPLFGKLPLGGVVYSYINATPEVQAGLQKLLMSMMGAASDSPELAKASALQKEAGHAEAYTVTTPGTPRAFNVAVRGNPAKGLEAAMALLKAMKGGAGIKDVAIQPNAESYKGISFSRIKMTMDLEKMAASASYPGGVEGLKKMFGGDVVTSYAGSDGKHVFGVAAPLWDEAKTQLDAVITGTGGIEQAPAYAAVRSKMPSAVSAMFMVNSQGFVKQLASQVGMLTGVAVAVPADLPKSPAYFGGALVASPKGYDFQLVVPSNVGPVMEQGLTPVIEKLQGQVKQ